MINNPLILEVCVDSVASAVAAEEGGAHRVELCADLDVGGVTPSAGMIEEVRRRITIGLHVMIRPRGGDFCYDEDEFEVMRRDVANAVKLKADAVVIGLLTRDGAIDVKRTRILVQLARPLAVTFHRAFDASNSLSRSLEELCALGVHRILSSGGERSAFEGRDILKQLVRQAAERTTIIAGAGIDESNAKAIVNETGVRELHVRNAVSTVRLREAPGAEPFGARHPLVDADAVRRLLASLR